MLSKFKPYSTRFIAYCTYVGNNFFVRITFYLSLSAPEVGRNSFSIWLKIGIERLSRNVDEKWNYKQTIEIHYSPYVSLIHHHLQAVQRSGWMEIVQGVEFANSAPYP